MSLEPPKSCQPDPNDHHVGGYWTESRDWFPNDRRIRLRLGFIILRREAGKEAVWRDPQWMNAEPEKRHQHEFTQSQALAMIDREDEQAERLCAEDR